MAACAFSLSLHMREAMLCVALWRCPHVEELKSPANIMQVSLETKPLAQSSMQRQSPSWQLDFSNPCGRRTVQLICSQIPDLQKLCEIINILCFKLLNVEVICCTTINNCYTDQIQKDKVVKVYRQNTIFKEDRKEVSKIWLHLFENQGEEFYPFYYLTNVLPCTFFMAQAFIFIPSRNLGQVSQGLYWKISESHSTLH